VVQTWSDEQVVRKWKTINRLIHSRDGRTIQPVTEGQIKLELARPGRIDQLRRNLSSVSHFMKALCEHISRRANIEENLSGTFFEERFCCRRLESDGAILVCGIYIDLNQIRAGEVLTPEDSIHTSAYDRIQARQERNEEADGEATVGQGLQLAAAQIVPADGWLCELTLDERAEAYRGADPSTTGLRASDKGLLPIRLDKYLALLDWTGRQIVAGAKGVIPSHFAPILERLGINRGMWLELITKFDKLFGRIVGRSQQVVASAERAGRRWYRGRQACADAFG
jgi:hypothetical protein